MAGSLMERLRARLEEMQKEMQPEAGFDRRAYGYENEDEAGAEDATFEEAALGEDSPWRRPGRDAPRPGPAPEGEAAARSIVQALGEPAPGPRRAAAPPEAAESPWARGGQPGGVAGRDFPSPSPREVRATASGRSSVAATDGRGSSSHGHERRSAPRASRIQRLRRRIRQPDSLRELFLLREIIDRPVALRRRRPSRPPS